MKDRWLLTHLKVTNTLQQHMYNGALQRVCEPARYSAFYTVQRK